MKKIFGILISGVALTAGVLTVCYLIKKNKKTKNQKDLDSGLYLLNPFRKIICELNETIAETEKRLANHDEIQKMYEEMEWKTSDN